MRNMDSATKIELGRVPTRHQYLEHLLGCLEQFLAWRIKHYFRLNDQLAANNSPDIVLPQPIADYALGRTIRELGLDENDQYLLLIALMPHLKPDLLDHVVQNLLPGAGDYPQLGGMRGKQHRAFLPTAETALFFLAGDDLEQRLHWQSQIQGDHVLIRKGILSLDTAANDEPPMSGRLMIDEQFAELFLFDKVHPPALSLKFPAQLLQTELTMDDLVLPTHTLLQVRELEHWVHFGPVLMQDWGMGKKMRPGLRALFYGPPGTGKTFTATLLGSLTGQPVYRVDLSMVISKYIGETEKNLASLFDKAENKNWILFFDEADALFGKRTQLKDAHDRFANQDVSYLLQRVENYNGLVILSSNLSNNVDEAFSRRFELMIHFSMPRRRERQSIWEKALPPGVTIEAGLDFKEIAAKFEISGGMIMNVVRYACLQSIVRGEKKIEKADLLEGIRREYAKENRLE